MVLDIDGWVESEDLLIRGFFNYIELFMLMGVCFIFLKTCWS
jgi:hypothetical protein